MVNLFDVIEIRWVEGKYYAVDLMFGATRAKCFPVFGKDFAFMEHLVDPLAPFAAELLGAIDGHQAEIGSFNRQSAQVAGG